MEKCRIEQNLTGDFTEYLRVWEASVRATHDFLKEEDIGLYKEIINKTALPGIEHLYSATLSGGTMVGFLGVQGHHIEMLFIHPSERGKGIGKQLILFAIEELHINSVDVNEQNTQALGFYQKMGFRITGRDDLDGQGKPYPILHMKLVR